MKKDIIKKLSVFFFFSSIAGVVISTMQMYEDVKSTAGTLLVYFPRQWGVFPATTENGSWILGAFVSVIQIVAIAIVFSNMFSPSWRIGAGVLAALSIPFDAWTDIVYRSGYLSGDLAVSSVTTIAFYTFGSEALSAFSWLLLVATWRQAIADISWTIALTFKNLCTIKPEFNRFMAAAERQASKELEIRIKENTPNSSFGFNQNNPQPSNSSLPSTRNVLSSNQVPRPAPKTPVVQKKNDSYKSFTRPTLESTYHPIINAKQENFNDMFSDDDEDDEK